MSETEKGTETAPMETEKPASSSADAPAPPIFEIKKWNAVTMWSWDICADACAICRNSLNEPSIEYQVQPLHPLECCFEAQMHRVSL